MSSALQTAPSPLVVHYSTWKVGAIALLIAWLTAWWAWRGFEALLAAEARTFHLWLTPVLGTVLTLAIFVGAAAQFVGKTSVVVIDETGLIVSDLYEDRIPWGAIGGITRVRGRGVVFEVEDGGSFGRKMTRNVRAGGRPSAPDMACIRSGLLDQPSQVILACMQAHQTFEAARRGKRA